MSQEEEEDYEDEEEEEEEENNEEGDDYDEYGEERQQEERLMQELKMELNKKVDARAKSEAYGTPPAGFNFSFLQEREENGLRLGIFVKPRISRTHFGIGFQDLSWNFYNAEVQATPSRTVKFVFKEACNIPQPGNAYEVHSHVLRYALADKDALGTGANRDRAIVSPVFTVISPKDDKRLDLWKFPHYSDTIISNNPANLRIQQESQHLCLYIELGVNVVRKDIAQSGGLGHQGDPAVQGRAIHCLSCGWAKIDLDDTFPLFKDDLTKPQTDGTAPPIQPSNTTGVGGIGVAETGNDNIQQGSGQQQQSRPTASSASSTRQQIKSVPLATYEVRPLPTKSKAYTGKLYAGDQQLLLRGGSAFEDVELTGNTGKVLINAQSKEKPYLVVEVRDPRDQTKTRNASLPATILYPRQYQPSILTYRRLLARRLAKLDEQYSGLLSSPCEPLTFKADSADHIFKIFPSILDSSFVMGIFVRRWTDIYKLQIMKQKITDWETIAQRFKELTLQIWPLVHLYSAERPMVPPILPALPNAPPHTAYPMAEKTMVALEHSLLNCSNIQSSMFLCGRIPAGSVVGDPVAAGGVQAGIVANASQLDAEGKALSQMDSRAIFRPFRASELRLNFAEGIKSNMSGGEDTLAEQEYLNLFDSILNGDKNLSSEDREAVQQAMTQKVAEVRTRIPEPTDGGEVRKLAEINAQNDLLFCCSDLFNERIASQVESPLDDLVRQFAAIEKNLADDLIQLSFDVTEKGVRAESQSNNKTDEQIEAQKLKEENERLRERIAEYERLTGSNATSDKGNQSTNKKGRTNRSGNALQSPIRTQKEEERERRSISQSVLPPVPTLPRILQLRQEEDLIEDIWKSKTKYDKKCDKDRLIKEPLSQHIITYMKTKFGIRNLVEDMYRALLQHLDMYQSQSNEVAVFKAALELEVDEDFRFVQKQLQETLIHLIHAFLRGKYSHESETQIIIRKKDRLNGGRLEEDEWRTAIRFMYNQDDSTRLISIIDQYIQEEGKKEDVALAEADKNYPGKIPRVIKKNRRPPQIRYPDLLKIILDFQLQNHIAYLQPFRQIFLQHQLNVTNKDKETTSNELSGTLSATSNIPQSLKNDPIVGKYFATGSGLVDEDGFIQLTKHLGDELRRRISDQKIDELLEDADPNCHKVITFSECVRVLAEEIEELVVRKQKKKSK
ncbi:MAG: hypothetical protein EZS28_015428 [Streblomastix strix]|uniref:Uncharacterized protein n=1 Tax=Streblomastix strix TaxID=222440 RepID=A0A5J4W2B7_9EUKA|nr:MAG: hypothetical protein EZS28_015428 [Streblomastix strix]